MQCTATSKRSGERCEKDAMIGGTVCHIHGGKSLKGIAAPQFHTGKHSKYLPRSLRHDYEAALSDPRLLELRAEISLLDARIADLLQRLEHGEAGAAWVQLQRELDAFTQAQRRRDLPKMHEHMEAIRTLITRGAHDADAWDEVAKLIAQRRSLVESERKREHEARHMISAEQALTLIGHVAEIVKTHVQDRATLHAIATDVARLTGAEVPPLLPEA